MPLRLYGRTRGSHAGCGGMSSFPTGSAVLLRRQRPQQRVQERRGNPKTVIRVPIVVSHVSRPHLHATLSKHDCALLRWLVNSVAVA